MSARVALILGASLVLAAVLHGGFYAAGHDFVMNRFTGGFVFVPSEDDTWDEEADIDDALCRTLTSRKAPDRVQGLYRRR